MIARNEAGAWTVRCRIARFEANGKSMCTIQFRAGFRRRGTLFSLMLLLYGTTLLCAATNAFSWLPRWAGRGITTHKDFPATSPALVSRPPACLPSINPHHNPSHDICPIPNSLL
jgi:hypothetical protein